MANTKIPSELVAINAISGTLIADNAITSVHIAQNNITATQIAINAVTALQMADGTITSAKIADGTIVTADIADGQITTGKIADGTITTDDLAGGIIISSKIANNAILTQHIDDNQITADQIADNAVGLDQMASLSRGSIIYGNAAGNPAYLAAGTNGHVLTSDGTDISWTADTDLFLASSGGTITGDLTISEATPTLKFTDTDNNYDATIAGLSGSLVLTADSGAEFGTETIQFHTGGSQRVSITSTGDVKVGALAVSSATTAPLVVAKASTDVQAIFGDNNSSIDDPSIRIIGRNTANNAIRYTFLGLDADTNHGYLGYNAGAGGFVNALNFDTSGNVGIGAAPTAGMLDIVGGASGVSVRVRGDVGAGAYYYGYMFDGTDVRGTTQTNIFYSGSAIAANTTIAEYAGIRIDQPNTSASGAVVTNNYAIYSSGSAQKSYFAGKVGIGTTTPESNHAKANNLVVGGGGAGGMAVYNGTAEGWYAFSRSNANNTDAYDGGMSYTDRVLKFHTNAGEERMRIDSSGNVGIGMNPSGYGKLSVNSTGVILALRASSGAGKLGFYEAGAGRFYLETLNGSDGLKFVDGDGTTERMRINASGQFFMNSNDGGTGKVTAATTWSGAKFIVRETNGFIDMQSSGDSQTVGYRLGYRENTDLSGYIKYGTGLAQMSIENNYTGSSSANEYSTIYFKNKNASGTLYSRMRIGGANGYISTNPVGNATQASQPIEVQGGTAGNIFMGNNLVGYTVGQYPVFGTSGNDLHFQAGNTYTGYISYNSGFTDVSDEREKENITTISNATAKLKQLRGVTHTWKDNRDGGATHLGLIAQEVKSVVPEVVSEGPTKPDETEPTLGVHYGKLVPLLIETIKELEARIKTLEG